MVKVSSDSISEILFCRGKGDYQIDYVPASRITEADKTNDRKYVLNLHLCFSFYFCSIGSCISRLACLVFIVCVYMLLYSYANMC